jgi:hypothetical protein
MQVSFLSQQIAGIVQQMLGQMTTQQKWQAGFSSKDQPQKSSAYGPLARHTTAAPPFWSFVPASAWSSLAVTLLQDT